MPSCLVIDDDAIFRRMAADILVAHGFVVREETTGAAGLENYLKDPTDVVLLDLFLPDLTGYDLLPKLIEVGAAGQVVITTADFSLDSALKTLRAGAGDYLPKPFSEESLLMSLERVMRRTALEKENQNLALQLRRRVSDLQFLHHVSQLITSNKPLEIWMDAVVRATSGYIGAQAGAFLLKDSKSDELFFYGVTGPRGEAIREIRLPRNEGGIAWWCLANREPVKVNDAHRDSRFNSDVDEHTGFLYRL
ncbi:MAG: response regulator [Deltaproteobacteria bacterium]|nr:response regulator [Deltaproteobacteria bacterium]